MNRTRAKELLEVITAFANGETIQAMCDNGDWVDTPCTSWMDTVPYRIKPKPRLRPWTPEEAPKFVMLRAKDAVCEYGVTRERMWRLVVDMYFCTTPKFNLRSESMCLKTALREYLRIDEQGNEHPCGVVCEGDK